MASSSASRDQDLAFLIVQFLNEHNFTETARMLEKEGKLYLNMKYVEEAVKDGKWKELEAYILCFTKINDNPFSLKLILEIRRQKYNEALDNAQYANALEILTNELEMFAPYDQEILNEIAELKYLNNVRLNKRLGRHSKDTERARCSVFALLRNLIENNPVLKDKLNYPSLEDSRLKILMNHSLNWQHTKCKYPKLNPAVSTLYVDHTCGDAVGQSLDHGDLRPSANLTPSNTDEREMPNNPGTNEQARLYSLRLPDPILSQRIDRLSYTNSGDAILALSSSGVFKFWKWAVANDNPAGKATTRVVPPIFSANFDISLGENVPFVPYFALSKNDNYVASVSAAGKVSLNNWVASVFKSMAKNMCPPPAATSVMFYPEDNNIIVIGRVDGSVLIYSVQRDMVIAPIHGHQKRVTGLAYSSALNILVSSGYDAQICAWSKFGWRKQCARFLNHNGNAVSPGHTAVKFHQDQRHLLVVHESCIATLEGKNLEPCNLWIPGELVVDAAYSCDGQSIYSCFLNRHIVVLDSASFATKHLINPSVYLPSNPSPVVYASALAANPTKHNQFALGLSDGGVLVVELEEGDNGIGRVARLSLRPATNENLI